jgi:hypothetical protein
MNNAAKRKAKKNADKMRNATGYNMEAVNKEAAADAEHIRETVAEAKQRGISIARVLRERRAPAGHGGTY